MDNNKIVDIEQYANLPEQIATLLNFSLPEIRKKYANYPICLIDYIEKEVFKYISGGRFGNSDTFFTSSE